MTSLFTTLVKVMVSSTVLSLAALVEFAVGAIRRSRKEGSE